MSKSSKNPSELKAEKKKINEITQLSGSTGKTTQQIMSRHIQDKNDVITEEDIRNLNIEPEITNDPAYPAYSDHLIRNGQR